MKIEINVAYQLFLTFLHSKSKKKVNDEKLDTYDKYPIITFAEIILAPLKCIELVFFIRKLQV